MTHMYAWRGTDNTAMWTGDGRQLLVTRDVCDRTLPQRCRRDFRHLKVLRICASVAKLAETRRQARGVCRPMTCGVTKRGSGTHSRKRQRNKRTNNMKVLAVPRFVLKLGRALSVGIANITEMFYHTIDYVLQTICNSHSGILDLSMRIRAGDLLYRCGAVGQLVSANARLPLAQCETQLQHAIDLNKHDRDCRHLI